MLGQDQAKTGRPALFVRASGFAPELAHRAPSLQVSGWRTPTLSGGVARWKDIGLATFRVDCLAIRETEYGQYGRKML
ncbi:hypothetical protein [Phyllobacterium myrsinacearum]|uniref:Uncharacterized protein n=1 Tax=Phyllobacterium myrsinacearum TaxID=28101 RepID=A0A839EKD9_9HYPH|nr:hypothetical protein [Phyllobacterium myrsinacearum]MBA8878715.1 hypothetical protein [Phyllobacterium myrsinacearum]